MRKNLMSLVVALAFFPTIAGAQMMGGGNHRGNNPAPPSSGMPDENGFMDGAMGNHRGLVVGTDGTLYTVRVVKPTTESPAATFEIVAVSPAGTIAWTASASSGMTFFELSGNHLLVATSARGSGMGSTSTSPSSRLVALSPASGAEQWGLQLDGLAMDLEPFTAGTYVIVLTPAENESGEMHNDMSDGSRKLVAVGNDGKVLWSVPLTR